MIIRKDGVIIRPERNCPAVGYKRRAAVTQVALFSYTLEVWQPARRTPACVIGRKITAYGHNR